MKQFGKTLHVIPIHVAKKGVTLVTMVLKDHLCYMTIKAAKGDIIMKIFHVTDSHKKRLIAIHVRPIAKNTYDSTLKLPKESGIHEPNLCIVHNFNGDETILLLLLMLWEKKALMLMPPLQFETSVVPTL